MSVIGVNLEGSILSLGRIENNQIEKIITNTVDHRADKFIILENICDLINDIFTDDVSGIGFGVPSMVDIERGIVFDVHNIPSWKRVHLKDLLEKRFKVPVYVNNDANCFAVGERHFGKTKKSTNSVGLIIGMGVGSGIILNHKLFSGKNCMAGEFGKIPYMKHDFEYYCCEGFFEKNRGRKGIDFFNAALQGDEESVKVFDEFGYHLGNLIKTILYSVDPDMIVLGNSASKYFELFKDAMWDCIKDFVFPQSIKNLQIEVSDTDQIHVLGAAALYLDANGV
jgi:glucokinase